MYVTNALLRGAKRRVTTRLGYGTSGTETDSRVVTVFDTITSSLTPIEEGK